MKAIDYKKVGKRVKLKRREFGLTQSQAAEKINISTHYWSTIERGKAKSVSMKTLFLMADLLDVGIDYLLVDSVERNNNAISEEIINMLDDMTKNQRIISMDLLKVVYNNPEMFETTEIGGYVKDDEYCDKY